MTHAPCTYPDCRNIKGDPVSTNLGWCEGCQRRFRKLLGRLVLDWVHLSTALPSLAPHGLDATGRHTRVTYGHPAEAASDLAADIATCLNSHHDSLADELGETPPPHPGVAERVRVRAAWRYLEPPTRIAALARLDWAADAAVEMIDLGGRVRATLGLSRLRQALPTPCPRCELIGTLQRTVGTARSRIECGACHHMIEEEDYPEYTRLVLDTLIDNEGFVT